MATVSPAVARLSPAMNAPRRPLTLRIVELFLGFRTVAQKGAPEQLREPDESESCAATSLSESGLFCPFAVRRAKPRKARERAEVPDQLMVTPAGFEPAISTLK